MDIQKTKGEFPENKKRLRQIILQYPQQLEKGLEFSKKTALKSKNYSNLIICGMGGSALPGDLLISYLENSNSEPLKLPILISRSYSLPSLANKNSLIFICSYSGNTEETIACLKEALQLKADIVTFSSGGKIQDISQRHNLPWINTKIDFPSFQPRYTATYVFSAMLGVLTNLGLSAKIKKLPKIDSSLLESEGEKLAQKIAGKTPIIYASNRFKALAKNWKIKINENAKTPAFWNYFPELNHNEMVGFTLPQGKFFVINLLDEEDHPQIIKRIQITSALYQEKGIETEIIRLTGSSFLEKLLWGLVLGDWTSFYLALQYNQDPIPVKMVEDLKKRL